MIRLAKGASLVSKEINAEKETDGVIPCLQAGIAFMVVYCGMEKIPFMLKKPRTLLPRSVTL